VPILNRVKFGLLQAQQLRARGVKSLRGISTTATGTVTSTATVAARTLTMCRSLRPSTGAFSILKVLSRKLLAANGRRRRLSMNHIGVRVQMLLVVKNSLYSKAVPTQVRGRQPNLISADIAPQDVDSGLPGVPFVTLRAGVEQRKRAWAVRGCEDRLSKKAPFSRGAQQGCICSAQTRPPRNTRLPPRPHTRIVSACLKAIGHTFNFNFAHKIGIRSKTWE
jgi:hypothetical protein